MTEELLNTLRTITPEEQKILDGRNEIDRELYVDSEQNTFDAKKLLEKGKLITIRPHTRFVHFPAHTHNYVEVIYMCSGHPRHIVNGNEVWLEQGELHYDTCWLSREIKRHTGKTYTDLVQDKRLSQAAYLLTYTAMPVIDIGLAVGYENISYFHRIFQKKYGITPRTYRLKSQNPMIRNL